MNRSAPPPTSSEATDQVRRASDDTASRHLDEAALEHLRSAATDEEAGLSRRIAELDREADIERWLMVFGSAFSLTGVALGVSRDRRFLLVSGAVLASMLQHGIRGWCPPVPVFRRLGARTHREIASERAAAKALRGDFRDIGGDGPPDARAALAAAARG